MAKKKSTNTKKNLETKTFPKSKKLIESENDSFNFEKKYDPIYCKKIIEYFTKDHFQEIQVDFYNKEGEVYKTTTEIKPNEPPFIQGFCTSIGITKTTLHRWIKKYPNFAEAYEMAKQNQFVMINANAIRGLYSTVYSIFLGKAVLGMRENSKELEIQDLQTIDHFLTKPNQITNVYFRMADAIYDGYKIILHRGGTRSSKTYSICQAEIDWLFTGEFCGHKINGNIGVLRKSLPFLKLTWLLDILEICEARGIDLENDINWNKTEHYFERDARRLYYLSVGNEKEIKKVRGLGLGLIHLNEANELHKEVYDQLVMRSKEGALIIMDYNPDDETSWVNERIEKERSELKKDVKLIKSTYLDNKYLSQSTIDEIEYFEKIDQDLWNIYGKGEYGSILGKIYPNWETYEQLPPGDYITVNGHDFGFSNSKDANMEVNYRKGTNELYIKSKIYQTGLSSLDLIIKMRTQCGDNKVFADCAEARMLSDARRSGIKIFKVKKQVQRQIKLSKSFKVFYYVDDLATKEELKTYVFLKNDAGKLTSEPIDINNHLMKAFQYAVTGLIDLCGVKIPELKNKNKTERAK